MRRQDQNGFTMLELLVATAVALGFALAGWSFQRTQAQELSNQTATIDATDTIRAATGFLASELRQAGYDPRLAALTTAGSRGISDARSDQLWIQFDTDGDGTISAAAIDPNAESVLYLYDSIQRTVTRTVASSTETLITDVYPGGFGFEYFDANGNALTPSGSPDALTAAQRDLVASVRIRLRVSADTSAPSTLQMASRVALRNRVLDTL
jgi:prepilin-type N-terminal cleavage/methylation domain-containing protein